MSHMHMSVDCVDFHDKVVDWFGRRKAWRRDDEVAGPEVVVLCGSTRFFDQFRAQNLRLTLEGKIVLSIGCDTKSDGDLFGQTEDLDTIKHRLDELHKRKIDLADRVLVLNIGGYIGESTRSEIAYAEKRHRRIDYLEPIYPSLTAAEALLISAGVMSEST